MVAPLAGRRRTTADAQCGHVALAILLALPRRVVLDKVHCARMAMLSTPTQSRTDGMLDRMTLTLLNGGFKGGYHAVPIRETGSAEHSRPFRK
ncbi:MAG: hypothetical protein ABIN37_06570 [Burkholderiaceae bacterium]